MKRVKLQVPHVPQRLQVFLFHVKFHGRSQTFQNEGAARGAEG